MFLKAYIIFLKVEKEFLMLLILSPIKVEGTGFSGKVSDNSRLKILTPKQMLQRLPIAFAQVKSGNTSKTLLTEISHIIYSLYRGKEIALKKCITI